MVVVVARIGPDGPGLRGVCAAGGSMGDNRGCCFVMQADMLASSSRRIQEFLTAEGGGGGGGGGVAAQTWMIVLITRRLLSRTTDML